MLIHSTSMPLGICFSGEKKKLSSILGTGHFCNCCPDGCGSPSPVTDLLGPCFSEGPTPAGGGFLEALSEAAFPRREGGWGLPGWPGNWKQGGLCPFCPTDICFPWGAIRIGHSGAACSPLNGERHTCAAPRGPLDN